MRGADGGGVQCLQSMRCERLLMRREAMSIVDGVGNASHDRKGGVLEQLLVRRAQVVHLAQRRRLSRHHRRRVEDGHSEARSRGEADFCSVVMRCHVMSAGVVGSA